jgi:hypothetical protein
MSIVRTILSIIMMIAGFGLILPILVLILPVWLFVSMCKGLNKQLVSSNTIWQQIIQYTPQIGWKPKKRLNNIYYSDPSGDIGSITTGSDGWPCQFTISESDIVVFGDSFAFGYGSLFENAYYNLAGNLRIKPVASPGYNMVQPLQLMKKYRDQLNGKLVVWFICLENDLSENIRMDNSVHYTAPFISKNGDNRGWKIVTTHVQSRKWLYSEKKSHNTLRYAKLSTPSPYSERIFEASEFLVKEANEICRTAGANLMILTIPDKRQLTQKGIGEFTRRLNGDDSYNADLPDNRFKEVCEKLNIPVISGKEYLTIDDYKVRDGHWNKKGNQKIAGLIKDFYHNDYLLQK